MRMRAFHYILFVVFVCFIQRLNAQETTSSKKDTPVDLALYLNDDFPVSFQMNANNKQEVDSFYVLVNSALGQVEETFKVDTLIFNLQAKARILIYKNEQFSAIDELSNCLQKDSLDATTYALLGVAYLEYQPELSILNLSKAISLNQSNWSYWADLALAYVYRDQLAMADSILSHLDRNDYHFFKYWQAKAALAYSYAEYENTVIYTDSVLVQFPSNYKAVELRVLSLLNDRKIMALKKYCSEQIALFDMPLKNYIDWANLIEISSEELQKEPQHRVLFKTQVSDSIRVERPETYNQQEYIKLLNLFTKDYKSLTLSKYALLYLRQTSQPTYTAIDLSTHQAEVLEQALESGNYSDCFEVGSSLVKNDPTAFWVYPYLSEAAIGLGKLELSIEFDYKYIAFTSAVLAVGEGDTFASSILITGYSHRERLLEELGYEMSGSETIVHNNSVYEKAYAFDRASNRHIFFFRTNEITKSYQKIIKTK